MVQMLISLRYGTRYGNSHARMRLPIWPVPPGDVLRFHIFYAILRRCSQRGVSTITLKIYNEKCAPSGFPHSARSTAAIVVISMWSICLQLSILYSSCRRVCGGGIKIVENTHARLLYAV
ncbi:uncharacterized protein METZ01_LOCUS209474 [marine metagenome]|uniref:Uncharacterized protein n=1 Tax=marine metagenome TaxID=408172 RepID=A0A382F0Y4_9ZZZZ